MKTESVLLVLSFGCLAAHDAPAVEVQSRPAVIMRVLNPAGVASKTLGEAERMVAAILGQAGVTINWLECPRAEAASRNPCLRDPGPNEFWIHLLSNNPPRLNGDATGFAVLMPAHSPAASYAGVAWPAVEAVAAGADVPVSDVLGATIAHEIGHILLHSSAHAHSGIMRRRFQKAELRLAATGQLRFTPDQARRMRAEVARMASP